MLVQHEFGIFGGLGGDFAVALLRPLAAPALLTLHTAERGGGGAQNAALATSLAWAAAAVTMARDGCDVVAGWHAQLGARPGVHV